MSIGFKGFNHTGINVTDLDAAIAFFTEGLGFELLSRAPRDDGLIERVTGVPAAGLEVVFLQGPGHRIELIRYTTASGRPAGIPAMTADGVSHLALDVSDMEAAVAMAESHGFSRLGEIVAIDNGPNKGRQVVYMASPIGLNIEFIRD